MPTNNELDRKLQQAMDDSLRAYSTGQERFFSYFTDDARIYSLESSEPIIGRAAFAKAFGPTLAAVQRNVEIVESDIQAHGDHVVIAQVLQIETNGVIVHVRQSVVWERNNEGSWLMSHIHNTLIGKPVLSAGADIHILRTADRVRVLNERIATAAAAVGVAQ